MDQRIRKLFNESENGTKEECYEALLELNKLMDQPVDWAYEIWDELVELLTDKDGHQRTRAAQYLSRLAAHSDPENRIINDFDKVWQVTFDEKFVTARHTIQAIWRIGLGSEEAKGLLLNHIETRFYKGQQEKNYTLIRNDFLVGMRALYDQINDSTIKDLANSLIASVEDEKYKKKYEKIWK